jgi:hypothetical protein
MGCNCGKKPSPTMQPSDAPERPVGPVRVVAYSAPAAAARVTSTSRPLSHARELPPSHNLAIIPTDGIGGLRTMIRDTDGTQLPDLNPYDPAEGPVVREPVDASTGTYDGGASPGVVVLDGAQVDAHTSALGQALEALARIFTGSTP